MGGEIKTFNVARPFHGGIAKAFKSWENEGLSKSAEICYAIMDRAQSQEVRGFVIPRVNQPAVDYVKLLEEGKLSIDEAREMVENFEDHAEQMKKLSKAIEVAKEMLMQQDEKHLSNRSQ